MYDAESPLTEQDREIKNNITMQLYDMTQELAYLVYEVDEMITKTEAEKNSRSVQNLMTLKKP